MHAVDYEQLRIQHVNGNETLDVRYNTPLMTIMSLLLIQRLMNANIDHRVSRNTSSNFRKKSCFSRGDWRSRSLRLEAQDAFDAAKQLSDTALSVLTYKGALSGLGNSPSEASTKIFKTGKSRMKIKATELRYD